MTGTHNQKNYRKGFTLVELLITVALFTIIIAIAVGTFTNALRTQRQVSSLISAESNVSLSLEQMARDIRTGYLFCNTPGNTDVTDGGGTNPSPGALPGCGCALFSENPSWWECSSLIFYDAEGNHVEYTLPIAGPGAGSLAECDSVDPAGEGVCENGPFQSLTGNTVSLEYLHFFLYGQVEGDQWTPRITITMGITPSSTDSAVASTTFNLETTVSARTIDCEPGGGLGSC